MKLDKGDYWDNMYINEAVVVLLSSTDMNQVVIGIVLHLAQFWMVGFFDA